MSVAAFWMSFGDDMESGKEKAIDRSLVGMMKSELLGRLMRGEGIRRKPCPRHRGKMWCSWGTEEQMKQESWSCCEGTGWLRNEEVKK
jgi:hypothetical protein